MGLSLRSFQIGVVGSLLALDVVFGSIDLHDFVAGKNECGQFSTPYATGIDAERIATLKNVFARRMSINDIWLLLPVLGP